MGPMGCDRSLEFSASLAGLPLEMQLTHQRGRISLSKAGPGAWRQLAQTCDALSIQLRREEIWRQALTDKLFEHGIPIPMPPDLSAVVES